MKYIHWQGGYAAYQSSVFLPLNCAKSPASPANVTYSTSGIAGLHELQVFCGIELLLLDCSELYELAELDEDDESALELDEFMEDELDELCPLLDDDCPEDDELLNPLDDELRALLLYDDAISRQMLWSVMSIDGFVGQ